MGGTSCGTGTTLARLTTTWVAKPETPRWWYTGRPPRLSRIPPPSSVPALLAALPGSHGVRPSVAHAAHWPQRGRNTSTTR
ncbi:Uncharacterised protein [Mycobacterium tuberculosis]|nr:Uncharacterised protein [Mycobacterium tuberculosis]COY62862.1 Uncharacterised protein [Mycobacterium tuberculosis]